MNPQSVAQSETDLCQVLWKELQKRVDDYGFNVPVVIDGQRVAPDIVVVIHGRVYVYEVKVRLSPYLIGQVVKVHPYADYTYAVVGEPITMSKPHQQGRMTLAQHRIGLVYISDRATLEAQMPSVYSERRDDRLLDALTDAQKSDTPGRPGGKVIRPDGWDDVRDLLHTTPKLRLTQIASLLDWSKHKRAKFHRLTTRGEIRGITWKGAPAEFECDE